MSTWFEVWFKLFSAVDCEDCVTVSV